MIIDETDILRYDQMVERALRNVVIEALQLVAQSGLPGDHHFYITFATQAPGVQISPVMLARYPQEMTIVLQHQFWDLDVAADYFGVTLSFSGKMERLVIPYATITGFTDPSAKFGLQFQVGELEMDEDEEDPRMVADAGLEPVPQNPAGEDLPEAGAKVVTLDAFRKK